jgi:hypothetical protein
MCLKIQYIGNKIYTCPTESGRAVRFLPTSKKDARGPPARNPRDVLNGILWILHGSFFSIVWTLFSRSLSRSICPLARLPAWDTDDSLIRKWFPIVFMNRFFLAGGDWVHGLSSGKPMIQPSIQSGLPRRSLSEGWSILSNFDDTIESNSFNMKLVKF